MGIKSQFSFLIRYCNTIKFLTGRQVVYQFFYRIRYVVRKAVSHTYPASVDMQAEALRMAEVIEHQPIFFRKNRTVAFSLLNITKVWDENEINWGYQGNGRLWNYNLNYFDFLNQTFITKEEGCFLIQHFINNAVAGSMSFEPYPITLRGMNWIKFFL